MLEPCALHPCHVARQLAFVVLKNIHSAEVMVTDLQLLPLVRVVRDRSLRFRS